MTNAQDGDAPMTSDQILARVVALLDELEADLVGLAGWGLEVEQVGRFFNLYELVGLHGAARMIDAAFEDSYGPADWASM
jgi:hypothetical protein